MSYSRWGDQNCMQYSKCWCTTDYSDITVLFVCVCVVFPFLMSCLLLNYHWTDVSRCSSIKTPRYLLVTANLGLINPMCLGKTSTYNAWFCFYCHQTSSAVLSVTRNLAQSADFCPSCSLFLQYLVGNVPLVKGKNTYFHQYCFVKISLLMKRAFSWSHYILISRRLIPRDFGILPPLVAISMSYLCHALVPCFNIIVTESRGQMQI